MYMMQTAIMITLRNLSFSRGGTPLFTNISLDLPIGQKIGVVGSNGVGKSTLFELLKGAFLPDQGDVIIAPNTRLGFVEQEAPATNTSLLETVLEADTERLSLMRRAETAEDPNEIAEIHTRLNDIEAWSAEARAAQILFGLGFSAADQARTCAEFSGGWRMRVALAALLFSKPDVLLLDEPTNYLDFEGSAWLESFLAKSTSAALVISHDRTLLNRSVGYILHIEPHEFSLWKGGYDLFEQKRAVKLAQETAKAKRDEETRAKLQGFVDRFRAKASKAKQAQSRLKQIEKLGAATVTRDARTSKIEFAQPNELSPPLLNMEKISLGYGATPILSRISLSIEPDDRIALLGKNGQGKSTLSKYLAGELPPQGGNDVRHRNLKVGYFAQHQLDTLDGERTARAHLLDLNPDLNESKQRATLANFSLGADQADLEVKYLSGGQKARLALLLATYHAPSLLILDEPTNHLDMESRAALMEALMEYQGAVVLVSHDMHLLSLVADRLWLVDSGKVTEHDGDLEDYTRMVLSAANADKKQTNSPNALAKQKNTHQKTATKSHAALRKDVEKAEDRVDTLLAMAEKLQDKLSDPSMYDDANRETLKKWQAKFDEVQTALARAEEIWERAEAALAKTKT